MRIKLTFELSGKKQYLPLNYQYPISAWIYKVFAEADKEFTDKLHNAGYTLDNGKVFKLFTFSKLLFPNKSWKVVSGSDRLELWSRKAFLSVSFQLPEQSEKFIIGLFNNQDAFIGDKKSGVSMRVSSVEVLKTEDIRDKSEVKLKAIAPIVLGIQTDDLANEQYYPPTHAKYTDVFLNNLLGKYRACGKQDYSVEELDFRLIKLYTKTSLQRIKEGTLAETKVKGYYFDFEISGPSEIINVGINSGFGSMNSLGFGMVEVMEGEN